MALVGKPHCKLREQSDRNRMNIESVRVASYQSDRWPIYLLVLIYRLANAGFFSAGNSDEVECFSCHIRISNWKQSDSPKRRHKHASPICRFVQGKDVRNIADVNYVPTNQKSRSNVLRPRLDPNTHHSDFTKNGDANDGKFAECQGFRKADYRFEGNRLRTFKEWPLSLPVGPYELAAAGFHRVDGNTTVQCFACLALVPCSNWRVGDRPMSRHRRISPSCPFVLGKNTGNRSMTKEDRTEALRRQIHQKPEIETRMRPRYPRFVSRESRLSTFKSWNYSQIVDPMALVDAGLFYSNNKDTVSCFCCGCRLEQWLPGDNPRKEHAKWSPNCQWLQKINEDSLKSNAPHRTSVNQWKKGKELDEFI